MPPPTWSVACTTIEPPALVEAFAAHHLAQGALEVFVFLDDPLDAVAYDLDPKGPVRIIPCDEAHWSRVPYNRAKRHQPRQSANAEVAARRLTRADWIAHVDTDELLLPRGGRTVGDALAAVPPEIGSLRVEPAERAFVDPWDEAGLETGGLFKLRGDGLGPRLYGPVLGKLFPHGFQGHTQGKSFRRVARRDLRLRIHKVMLGNDDAPTAIADPAELVLLHLFPTSREDWRSKFERRLSTPGLLDDMKPTYRAQVEAVGRALAEGGADELFAALSAVSRDESDRLLAQGLAIAPRLPSLAEARRTLDPLRVPFAQTPPVPGIPVALAGMPGPSRATARRLLEARGFQPRDVPLDAELDLAALAREMPLVLDVLPVARWLDGAAPDASAIERDRLRRAWDRRAAVARSLGDRVVEWKVEVHKPRDVAARLGAMAGLGG